MMLPHGLAKLTRWSELAGSFADPIGLGPTTSLGLAVFAEVGCAVAIAFGLATRLAAIPLLITMLVAAIIIHGDDPWAKKEFALLYALPCLTLMLTGAGRYSLDARFRR